MDPADGGPPHSPPDDRIDTEIFPEERDHAELSGISRNPDPLTTAERYPA